LLRSCDPNIALNGEVLHGCHLGERQDDKELAQIRPTH
jgi:hypothetical protein